MDTAILYEKFSKVVSKTAASEVTMVYTKWLILYVTIFINILNDVLRSWSTCKKRRFCVSRTLTVVRRFIGVNMIQHNILTTFFIVTIITRPYMSVYGLGEGRYKDKFRSRSP